MAIVITETNKGRQCDGKKAQRTYYIVGAATELEAFSAMLSSSVVAPSIGNLPLYAPECNADELEVGRYLGTAVYRLPDGVQYQQPNSFSISFDVSGQTTRITQSKKTIAKYAPDSKTAKDFHGAINVNPDGSIDGTEIIVPALGLTITFTFSDSDVTTDYINTVSKIVGTVNVADFLGYLAGELLLSRVSGQRRNDGSRNWDITFGFAVSRNCTDGELPNGDPFVITTPNDGDITIEEKRGWDFLWVRYEETTVTSDSGNYSARAPVSAYVEQVYDYSDYAELGFS